MQKMKTWVQGQSQSEITQLCVFSCRTEILIFKSHLIFVLRLTLAAVAVAIYISLHLQFYQLLFMHNTVLFSVILHCDCKIISKIPKYVKVCNMKSLFLVS